MPWQALANANNSFLLTERRRHYLRYLGALTFFEVNGPSGAVENVPCCVPCRTHLAPKAPRLQRAQRAG